jgi:sugar phosphate isomerase/epimerase
MAILTHGSDLSLAPTIRPIVKQTDGTVKTALTKLSEAGFRAVQLDATLPGIRPRELSQRDRRDLVSVTMRQSMTIGGIDLFIPRKHYRDPANIDRAMAATIATIELAADLGRVPVSLSLPVKAMAEDTRKLLIESADGRGVTLAIHAEDQLDALLAWVELVDMHCVGIAIDPTAILAQSKDPCSTVHKLSKKIRVARLADVSGTDVEPAGEDDDEPAASLPGVRSDLGEGDLDVVGYRLAVDLCAGRTGPVVLDLRGLENPLASAKRALQVWKKAAFTV